MTHIPIYIEGLERNIRMRSSEIQENNLGGPGNLVNNLQNIFKKSEQKVI